jgi:hypothetical protein
VHAYEVEDQRPAYQSLTVSDPTTGLPLFNPDGSVQLICKLTEGLGGSIAVKEVTPELLKASSAVAKHGDFRLVQQHSPWVEGSDDKPVISFEAGGAFVDDQGGACRIGPVVGRTADIECRADGPEIAASGTFSDPACENQIWAVYGGGPPADIEPALLRRFRLDDRRWLSFKPYTGPLYARPSATSPCAPYDEKVFAVTLERAVPLPSLELVER